jgi:DNA-binding response OmpR family regulator
MFGFMKLGHAGQPVKGFYVKKASTNINIHQHSQGPTISLGARAVVRILIVEDDLKLAGALRRGLQEYGHAVDQADDGEAGLALAERAPFDLIILDVLLPGLDGFEVCRRLRLRGQQVPVLMLTARDAVEDRVAGLDSGADDYLVKPFALPELLARVRALLRRQGPSRDRVLRAGRVEMDTATQTVRCAGRAVDLTSREYAVLEYLLRNPDRPHTRAQIAEHVWGFGSLATSNVIDVYIGVLRRKLGDNSEAPLLCTVRGVGYELRSSPV